jgi:organic radical activating enzyme
MKDLHIYLTNQTNVDAGLACDLFKASLNKNDNIYIDVLTWLFEARGEGFEIARFSGGEPTLNFNALILCIQRAKQLGYFVTLKTNGWFANNPEYWQALQDAGLDFFRITYDSDFFYNGSPLTKEIFLKAVEEAKKRFRYVAIITDDAEPDIAEIKALNTLLEIVPISRIDENYRLSGLKQFVIDFKGRVFSSSSGMFYAENTGNLNDCYLGNLNSECFSTINERFINLEN